MMGTLREIVKKMPVIPTVYRALHRYQWKLKLKLKLKSTEQIFTEIHDNNAWGGRESVSGPGPGSDVDQTKIIAQALPNLFKDFKISTMLDIPCGDFHWMKGTNLSGIDYMGADIVEELIQKNSAKYTSERIRFQHMNLMKDKLPKVDLIFCRDCLIHFSSADILLALDNICNSQSEYLLTTTYTARKNNGDIATGQWRQLNLQIAPFYLPNPLKIIHEGCTEGAGAYADKAQGLWKILDIRESLDFHNNRHTGN